MHLSFCIMPYCIWHVNWKGCYSLCLHQCSVLKDGRCLYVLRYWELLFQSQGFFCCIFFFSLGIGCWTWCRNLTLLHIKSQASVRNVTKADGERDYNTSESFRLEEIIVSFVLNECQKSTNWLKDGKESILEYFWYDILGKIPVNTIPVTHVNIQVSKTYVRSSYWFPAV